MANPAPQWLAGGNIYPSRFVSMTVGTGFEVVQSGSNSKIVGISMEGTAAAPIPGASAYAAVSGDNIKVYTLGDQCMLTAGSGGWQAGQRLISDSTGRGTPATAIGALNSHIGAYALDNAAENETVLVQIIELDSIVADS